MQDKKKNKALIIIVIIIASLLVLVGGYFLLNNSKNDTSANTKTNSSVTKNTNDNSANINEVIELGLEQYDGKDLKVTSADGSIDGVGKIAYQSDTDSLTVYFNAFVTEAYDNNGTCGGSADPEKDGCTEGAIKYEYDYKMSHPTDKAQDSRKAFYPVLCNNGTYPEDISSAPWDLYGADACGVDRTLGAATDTFLVYGSFEFTNYEGIINTYDLGVYDASQSWYIAEDNSDTAYDIGDTVKRYQMDMDKALVDANLVKSYNLQIIE